MHKQTTFFKWNLNSVNLGVTFLILPLVLLHTVSVQEWGKVRKQIPDEKKLRFHCLKAEIYQ